MRNIDEKTDLLKGDILYGIRKQKYFEIEDIGFNKNFREIIVNLKPVDNNIYERGFTIRISGLFIKYQIVIN